MDRNQELNDILNEPVPAALEHSVKRARARYNKSKIGRWCGIPVASLVGAAAAFVLLVNTSVPFARACGSIPFLKEFAAAVAFSPSLKAAVENHYVQPMGVERTNNGVTMRIEYLIVDKKQLNIFFSLESEQYPGLLWGDSGIEGVTGGSLSVGGGRPEEGELHHVTADFMNGDVPDTLTFTYKVRYHANSTAVAPTKAPDAVFDGEETREESDYIAEFSFPLTFDPSFTETGVTYELNTPFTLDGQHFTAKTVEVYPSQVRFNIEPDADNTALLKGLSFYLTDEKGRRYDPISNGIIASGSGEHSGMTTYYLESNYFDRADRLTLHITRAIWLDKNREFVTVDIPAGKALSPLPQGVSLLETTRTGKDVKVRLAAQLGGEDGPYRTDTYSVAAWTYRDPEGGEHSFNSASSSGGFTVNGEYREVEGVPEGCFTEEFYLKNYPWDTVELGMVFSRFNTFETPISLDVK